MSRAAALNMSQPLRYRGMDGYYTLQGKNGTFNEAGKNVNCVLSELQRPHFHVPHENASALEQIRKPHMFICKTCFKEEKQQKPNKKPKVVPHPQV